MANFDITIAGDCAINLEFSHAITPTVSSTIRMAAKTLNEDSFQGIKELVPTFCSLMIVYDPCTITYDELCEKVRGKLRSITAAESGVKRIVVIPVCYGGEFGPDMRNVMEHANLSEQEVINIHSGKDYLIDMLGFLPGFAYLGGLDVRLHTPRLAKPRTKIPAGSVGIGGAQTGIYPLASPGGWQIIGKSPVSTYDPNRTPPILYEAGDYLRFTPITPEQYDLIKAQIAAGEWQCEVHVQGV